MFCFTPATLLLATGGLLAASDATPKATPRPDDPAAVAELQKLGARTEKDESGAIKGLIFGGAKATDTTLAHLKGLHSLERLTMPCIVNVTDRGLANLDELVELRVLYLGFSEITDAGLLHLKGIQNLEKLSFPLTKANITDAGLEHLRGLSHLRELRLGGAKVTEAGVAELQQALPNCKIQWQRPKKGEQQIRSSSDQTGEAGQLLHAVACGREFDGDPSEQIPVLVEIVERGKHEEVDLAIRALGGMKTKAGPAIPALCARLNDPRYATRSLAVDALVAIGEDSVRRPAGAESAALVFRQNACVSYGNAKPP
jgi:hypothetical protein